MDSDTNDSDSEGTSISLSELKSDGGKCDVSVYSDLGTSSLYDSVLLHTQPIPMRERGHSLCVERTTGLLDVIPEPRSKSLRLKRNRKDISK